MTTLLVPGTAKTSLGIADLLAANSQPYLLGIRSSSSKAKSQLRSSTTNSTHPTIHLDLTDSSTWDAVFTNDSTTPPIATIYLVPPPTIPDFVPILSAFIHTALRLTPSLKRIVFLSASLIPLGSPAPHGQIHALLDSLTQQGALAEYAVLRPTWFAQNFATKGSLHDATIQSEGRVYSATGPQGRLAFVDVADIAAVGWRAIVDVDYAVEAAADEPQTTAAAMQTTGVHISRGGRGREYFVLGPELLSYADVAGMLAELLGRKVEWVGLTVEELAAKLVEVVDLDPGYATVLAGLDRYVADGEEESLFVREGGGCVQGVVGRRGTGLREALRRALEGAAREGGPS